jgi:hypothetical protein
MVSGRRNASNNENKCDSKQQIKMKQILVMAQLTEGHYHTIINIISSHDYKNNKIQISKKF